jgi:hypothetical protein
MLDIPIYFVVWELAVIQFFILSNSLIFRQFWLDFSHQNMKFVLIMFLYQRS